LGLLSSSLQSSSHSLLQKVTPWLQASLPNYKFRALPRHSADILLLEERGSTFPPFAP